MREIMTVCGVRSAAKTGFCQCHEHLMIRKGTSFQINSALCIDDIRKTAKEVSRFRDAGGGTIVDAQPGGCGRMASALHEIAEQTKTNIIASTGFHKAIFYPNSHWIFTMKEEELADIFVHELTVGMYENIDLFFPSAVVPWRAGIIKTALDVEGLSPLYQKLFTACCTAARKTEVPLMVHIEKGSDPVMLFDFLMRQGIAPNQLIFCHLDRAVEDLMIHKALLSKGCYLEFDTIGRFKYHSDLQEIVIMKQLLDWGYEDRLLFSLDTTRERLKAYCPEAVGLDYILVTFVSLLRKNGISEEQIKKISHDNFIRVFTQDL